jgi:phosphatidylserine/phosphatidylglycerophosphate/cardiolipin synthase-like enzyme
MKISLICIILILWFTGARTQMISSQPVVSDITTTGMTLSWTNSAPYLSFLRYGNTPDLELGTLNSGTTSTPSVQITTGGPAQFFYVQAVAQDGANLDEGDTLVFITQSASSGDMRVYFNQSVNHDYALPGNEAVHLPQLIDDTLVEYINRAQESIDVAIYNTTSSSSVADYIGALNQAHNNGVQVRVIYNGDTGNTGIANLDPAIPRLESPEANFSQNIGIMHNKFLVFDANSSNPNLPIVWTGSTNLTTQQINTDANHAVIIQDQSLAKVYTLEFEEMWGGSGLNPDVNNAKFGTQKTENTPKILNIAGKRVECYFSPSDGTNARIIQAINEADDDLIINTMLITRSDLASAINFKHATGSNVSVAVNTEPQTSQFNTLRTSLNGRIVEYTQQTGILHHKTMMGNALSNNNPFVLTGSHNWSSSAEDRNDENTLIIYDEALTNSFLQEFFARFEPMAGQITAVDDTFLVEAHEIQMFNVTANDELYYTIVPEIEVLIPPQNGVANGSNFGFLNYYPNQGFLGEDSIQYITCNHAADSYCDTAWVRITVDYELSINEWFENAISIFPNPAHDELSIELYNQEPLSLSITDVKGQNIKSIALEKSLNKINTSDLKPGVYFFTFVSNSNKHTKRVIIQ